LFDDKEEKASMRGAIGEKEVKDRQRANKRRGGVVKNRT
jgi:hypothetical protein